MPKTVRIYSTISLALLLLGLGTAPALAAETPPDAAFAAAPVIEYADIAARVSEYNLSLKAAALAVEEIEDGLDDLEEYNDGVAAEKASLEASIGETQAVIAAEEAKKQAAEQAGEEFDETLLRQMRELLAPLQQTAAGLQYLSTEEAESSLAVAKVRLRSTRAAMINAAQNMFILCLQWQAAEPGLRLAVSMRQQDALLMQSRQRHGLANARETAAAELALTQAELELSAHYRQLQLFRDQLAVFLGYQAGTRPKLGAAPEPALTMEMDAAKDTETAVRSSFAIAELKAELGQAESSSGRQRIKLEIKETELRIGQAVVQQYQTVADAAKAYTAAGKAYNLANSEWLIMQARYAHGLLSARALAAAESEFLTAQAAFSRAELQWFWEQETYRAVCDGLTLSGE